MSTTSTIITIIICVLLVAAIGYALVKGIWTVSKKITVPIQIALFVIMLVCVVRLFCTKENAKKLYDGVEQTGIGQNVENTMRAALNLKPVEASKSEASSAQVKAAPVVPEPVTAPVVAAAPGQASSPTPKTEAAQVPAAVKPDSQTAEVPVVANSEVKATPPAPQTVAQPEPEKVIDYSHLNKGKKSFSYALPFNAKVTVGFKDNTYRVVVESLGKLDSSEKKEVGKMIFKALGEYVGKTIESWNKSKISIESRYDEADGRTHVFAVIPPDAID